MNEPLQKLLNCLPGHIEKNGYWLARCPAHDDTDPSLSVSLGDDGRVLINCHKGCAPANVVQAAGLTWSEMFPHSAPSRKNVRGKITAIYDYHAATGEILFQVLRYEAKDRGPNGEEITKKTFSQRRPKADGGWDYNMKGVQREIYGLCDIFARPEEPVWIIEGEKAVDYCKGLGLLATTASGGAAKEWEDHYNSALHGRDIIIIPDHDPIALNKQGTRFASVGREHAEQVADSVVGVARSVHVIELPGAQDKWGLDDWLQAGNPLSLLQDLVAHATPWVKGSKIFDRRVDPQSNDEIDSDDPYLWDKKVCADLGIHVLGESTEGKIPGVMLYSLDHQKTLTVPDLPKWRKENLVQFVGARAKAKIFSGNDDCPDDQYRMTDVKEAIASLAGLRSVETSLFGAGIWQIDNAMALVGSGECAILNGSGVFEQQLVPEYGGRVFDLRSSGKWFDLKYLNEVLPMAHDQFWRTEIVSQMDSIFRMWNFKSGENVPKLLTGLILATWVQSIWKWRPQVFVFGESGCGKTTLFQLLSGASPDSSDGLFGGLAMASSDYTAAAIRQSIGRSSKVVILDEMENGKNRKEFLMLARGAGRGSAQLRGTAHHKAVATRLAQIFWVASTETGLEREMDQNRYIVIEMLKGLSRSIKMPSDVAIRELGQKLLVSIVMVADRATELERLLSNLSIPNIPGRIIESYAVPAAAYAAVCGMTDDEAAQHLVSLLGTTFESDSVESDAKVLLSDILSARIDVGREGKSQVAQILEWWIREEGKFIGPDGFTAHCDSKYKDALMQVGIRVCFADEKASSSQLGDPGIFISHRMVREQILRGSEWSGQRLDQKLSRIPDSRKTKKLLLGMRPNGVWLPYRAFDGLRDAIDSYKPDCAKMHSQT